MSSAAWTFSSGVRCLVNWGHPLAGAAPGLEQRPVHSAVVGIALYGFHDGILLGSEISRYNTIVAHHRRVKTGAFPNLPSREWLQGRGEEPDGDGWGRPSKRNPSAPPTISSGVHTHNPIASNLKPSSSSTALTANPVFKSGPFKLQTRPGKQRTEPPGRSGGLTCRRPVVPPGRSRF